MAAFKNDGAVQYGSRILTIGSAAGGAGGTAYVADNFTVNRTSATIVRKNEIGEPSGQVSFEAEPATGSAQIQLETADSREPSRGWEFTVTGLLQKEGTPTPADVSEVFYIDSVGTAETQDGETKVPITFRKRITASS